MPDIVRQPGARLTGQVDARLAKRFYPGPLASQSLVDATNAWLEKNPDVPALRRLVVENLAGVERALAAQARDRQG